MINLFLRGVQLVMDSLKQQDRCNDNACGIEYPWLHVLQFSTPHKNNNNNGFVCTRCSSLGWQFEFRVMFVFCDRARLSCVKMRLKLCRSDSKISAPLEVELYPLSSFPTLLSERNQFTCRKLFGRISWRWIARGSATSCLPVVCWDATRRDQKQLARKWSTHTPCTKCWLRCLWVHACTQRAAVCFHCDQW